MHQHISKHRAKAISLSLFLIGLPILASLNAWWPGILILIGAALAMRQWLLERPFDVTITAIVFLGGFFTALFHASWKTLLPVLFGLGSIFLLFREYWESTTPTFSEQTENLNQEIEEIQHKQD